MWTVPTWYYQVDRTNAGRWYPVPSRIKQMEPSRWKLAGNLVQVSTDRPAAAANFWAVFGVNFKSEEQISKEQMLRQNDFIWLHSATYK